MLSPLYLSVVTASSDDNMFIDFAMQETLKKNTNKITIFSATVLHFLPQVRTRFLAMSHDCAKKLQRSLNFKKMTISLHQRQVIYIAHSHKLEPLSPGSCCKSISVAKQKGWMSCNIFLFPPINLPSTFHIKKILKTPQQNSKDLFFTTHCDDITVPS